LAAPWIIRTFAKSKGMKTQVLTAEDLALKPRRLGLKRARPRRCSQRVKSGSATAKKGESGFATGKGAKRRLDNRCYAAITTPKEFSPRVSALTKFIH